MLQYRYPVEEERNGTTMKIGRCVALFALDEGQGNSMHTLSKVPCPQAAVKVNVGRILASTKAVANVEIADVVPPFQRKYEFQPAGPQHRRRAPEASGRDPGSLSIASRGVQAKRNEHDLHPVLQKVPHRARR